MSPYTNFSQDFRFRKIPVEILKAEEFKYETTTPIPKERKAKSFTEFLQTTTNKCTITSWSLFTHYSK